MIIIEDSRQKVGHHDNVKEYCERNNITLIRKKLDVGDYMGDRQSPPYVSIDTKKGLAEVYSNVVHDHGRFKNECIRAQEANIKLIILVEERSIHELSEVKFWINPQQKRWDKNHAYHEWLKAHGKEVEKEPKPPVSSERLMGMMDAMQQKYGIEWYFCHPDRVGEFVYRILTLNE